MHDTAQISGHAFFVAYGKPGCRILDVGSCDVNGTLRASAPEDSQYVGIDIAPGPCVDIVIASEERLRWPLETGEFDLAVSTSCFEHDPMFWATFAETARVVRPGGFIYISAPANGPYHGYPMDCWRFYKDAARGLVEWASVRGYPVGLFESFEVLPRGDVWIDQVMIFGRGGSFLPDKSVRQLLTAAGVATK
jgi:SAM-dependent methyltransferase